jgi:internalin A
MLEKLLGKSSWLKIAKRYAGQCIVFSLTLILIVGGYKLPEAVGQRTQTANYKTFTDWCANKANLNPEARRTVDALLKEAETNECAPANKKLLSLKGVLIWDSGISDITPLKSLTHLTTLALDGNNISDITPLTSLTNLTHLSLRDNKILDIASLKSLTKLTTLDLSGNPIKNKICPIKPESICQFDE